MRTAARSAGRPSTHRRSFPASAFRMSSIGHQRARSTGFAAIPIVGSFRLPPEQSHCVAQLCRSDSSSSPLTSIFVGNDDDGRVEEIVDTALPVRQLVQCPKECEAKSGSCEEFVVELAELAPSDLVGLLAAQFHNAAVERAVDKGAAVEQNALPSPEYSIPVLHESLPSVLSNLDGRAGTLVMSIGQRPRTGERGE